MDMAEHWTHACCEQCRDCVGQDIRDKYKELLDGVGLRKGYELKLNIDGSVKPVTQPVRRITICR